MEFFDAGFLVSSSPDCVYKQPLAILVKREHSWCWYQGRIGNVGCKETRQPFSYNLNGSCWGPFGIYSRWLTGLTLGFGDWMWGQPWRNLCNSLIANMTMYVCHKHIYLSALGFYIFMLVLQCLKEIGTSSIGTHSCSENQVTEFTNFNLRLEEICTRLRADIDVFLW